MAAAFPQVLQAGALPHMRTLILTVLASGAQELTESESAELAAVVDAFHTWSLTANHRAHVEGPGPVYLTALDHWGGLPLTRVRRLLRHMRMRVAHPDSLSSLHPFTVGASECSS